MKDFLVTYKIDGINQEFTTGIRVRSGEDDLIPSLRVDRIKDELIDHYKMETEEEINDYKFIVILYLVEI